MRLAMTLLVLAGCTATPYTRVCPPLIQYPANFEHAAAEQLAKMPPNSPVVVMMGDYAALRAADRTCVGQ